MWVIDMEVLILQPANFASPNAIEIKRKFLAGHCGYYLYPSNSQAFAIMVVTSTLV